MIGDLLIIDSQYISLKLSFLNSSSEILNLSIDFKDDCIEAIQKLPPDHCLMYGGNDNLNRENLFLVISLIELKINSFSTMLFNSLISLCEIPGMQIDPPHNIIFEQRSEIIIFEQFKRDKRIK